MKIYYPNSTDILYLRGWNIPEGELRFFNWCRSLGVAKKQKGHSDTSSDTAVSLKKGGFTTPSVNPIFQKENGGLKCNISKPPFCAARPNSKVLLCLPAQLLPKRKEPINRLPIGYGLSALRLCVWLFYNRNIQILCGNKCFSLTLRTIQRKIYEYCISSDF